MITKKLEDVVEPDVDDLLANSVAEGKTIEYKRELPGNADAEKKEFLANVSSFANTAGGDLFFGIAEDKGVPTEIPGLIMIDSDLEIRRLDSMINDGLDPKIRFSIRPIQRDSNPPLLIIRVERSWIGPHRVVFKGHDKFYARNSAGKYPMDISELRSAFNLTATVTERVRQFRADRVKQLTDNRTPIPFVAGSKTIFHCIPLESFARPVQYDVMKLGNQPQKIPMLSSSGWNHRINLNGILAHNTSTGPATSYTQLYRNGVIEGVEGYWLNIIHEGQRLIPNAALERELCHYLHRCFAIQKEIGVNPPVIVAIALTQTKGLRMPMDLINLWGGYGIQEDDLVLPESVVESFDQPSEKILKPIFDLVWNACGLPQSMNFDAQGKWVERI